MGIIEGIATKKTLSYIKDEDVQEEIVKIAGSVDKLLDKFVGDRGSSEIRKELCQILEKIKTELAKDT